MTLHPIWRGKKPKLQKRFSPSWPSCCILIAWLKSRVYLLYAVLAPPVHTASFKVKRVTVIWVGGKIIVLVLQSIIKIVRRNGKQHTIHALISPCASLFEWAFKILPHLLTRICNIYRFGLEGWNLKKGIACKLTPNCIVKGYAKGKHRNSNFHGTS